VLLVIACVASRIATTITYIEDPDSLRFAMSVANGFDLAAMQPHFPGYPIFWAVVTPLYVLLGSFSTAFSIVGGLATAGIVGAVLFLWNRPLVSVPGMALAALVVLNPLVWLMGNRYMPDLLGTACALAALAFLVRSTTGGEKLDPRLAMIGVAGAGLLAGLRLSYLPLLFVPVLVVFWKGWAERGVAFAGRLFLTGLASVAVWLVPMIVDTGWHTLIDVATAQTSGHFTEFGGTVQTESDLGRRVAGFVQGIWADGLGAWWPGRHPLTIAVGTTVVGLAMAGGRRLMRRRMWRRLDVWVVLAGALTYALWAFFFQNVIHKSRHILPLLPLVLWLFSVGATALWQVVKPKVVGRAVAGLGIAAYAAVTLVLVYQHQSPTAIAQVKAFLDAETQATDSLCVVSDPLVNTYLDAQDVPARYIPIDDTAAVRQAVTAGEGRTVVVGSYPQTIEAAPSREVRFYHNPFVNRMWSDVTVHIYEFPPSLHESTQHGNDDE
jgi:hypothetical protein